MLEDETDVAPLGREPRRQLVADDHLAAVRLLQPGDDAQQRRLAATARSQQRGQRPVRHIDRDIIQCLERSKALAQMANRDTHQ
jgi:hypothetical protein